MKQTHNMPIFATYVSMEKIYAVVFIIVLTWY